MATVDKVYGGRPFKLTKWTLPANETVRILIGNPSRVLIIISHSITESPLYMSPWNFDDHENAALCLEKHTIPYELSYCIHGPLVTCEWYMRPVVAEEDVQVTEVFAGVS